MQFDNLKALPPVLCLPPSSRSINTTEAPSVSLVVAADADAVAPSKKDVVKFVCILLLLLLLLLCVRSSL